MKHRSFLSLCTTAVLLLVPAAPAQDQLRELDGSDLARQLRERQEKIRKLSTEEQEALQAAQRKAMEDPEVKAAFAKREEAARQFQAALRASLLRSDPAIGAMLERIGPGSRTRP